MTYRVRRQSASGDYTFGQGAANFLVDSPEAVAQRVLTRLNMWEGDWYLDLSDGTPQYQQILGHKNIGLAQALIRERVLGTPFVTGVDNFGVNWNEATRHLHVSATIHTAFGLVFFDYPVTPLVRHTFTIGADPIGAGGVSLG